MSRLLRYRHSPQMTGIITRSIGVLACASLFLSVQIAGAQEVPLISGGVGFVTSTNGGNTALPPCRLAGVGRAARQPCAR